MAQYTFEDLMRVATTINKRTLEKGGKWFTFVINKRVNELLGLTHGEK
jgi:hypothetical protein